MKTSKIFIKAAELLDAIHSEGGGTRIACCAVIYQATMMVKVDPHTSFEVFFDFFKPEGRSGTQYWWGNPKLFKDTNERVLALLFAAELSKDNGD